MCFLVFSQKSAQVLNVVFSLSKPLTAHLFLGRAYTGLSESGLTTASCRPDNPIDSLELTLVRRKWSNEPRRLRSSLRYSGVAWAWSPHFKESQRLVQNWNGYDGEINSAKVPTTLLYLPNDEVKWGFEIPPGQRPLRWFKLLLLEPADMSAEVRTSGFIRETKQMLAQLRKDPVDVVSDYLRLLWNYIGQEMIRVDGRAEVEGQPFRVVITYPAIWP